MVTFSDIIYYNFLKKAAIVLVILGILIGIFAVSYTWDWITGVKQISETSPKLCSDSTDCFEWCGECVSIKDSRNCGLQGIRCACINGTCQKA